MSTITLTVAKVPANLAKQGKSQIDQYRNDGGGSNRTDWERLALIAGAIATVLATGKSVEVTDYFPDTYKLAGGVTKPITSPGYNVAHRPLSAGAIRPEWHNVQVHSLVEVTVKGSTHTGTSNTTARIGSCRLYFSPVA